MDAALHRDDALPRELAEDEVPRMETLHRRDGKVRNVLVGNGRLDLDLLRETTEAAAENDPERRLYIGDALDVRGAFLYSIEKIRHE